MRYLWIVLFLVTSYLEAPHVFPAWVPDLALLGLLIGPLWIPFFAWIALIGGLLRGGWMGWMTFPLIHVAYAIAEPAIRGHLNLEGLPARIGWYSIWALILGSLLHVPWPRALTAGLLAAVLSMWDRSERP